MSEENESATDNQALKNAIFAAKAAKDGASNGANPQQQQAPEPGVPISREEYAKQELGIEIPVDLVPLPSQGLVYPGGHPLHKATQVEYKGMTVREEDILTSAALIKKGTVINELIKSCLLNKNLDVNSLLGGDRNAIMIAIRASGYGRIYTPAYTCPKCDTQQTIEIDLAELGIKNLEIEPVQSGENLFSFELPRLKKEVLFKFLTGADEEEILSQLNARKKRGIQTSNLITTRLMSSVVAINGNRERNKLRQFIENMPAFDSKELRKYIDKHEPGVSMKAWFECSQAECGHTEEVGIPMDASFFWPQS